MSQEYPASLCDPREVMSILTSIVATTLAVVYWLFRIGFDDNPLWLPLGILLVSYYLLFFPSAIRIICQYSRKSCEERWYHSHAALLLWALIALVVAGLVRPLLHFSLLPVFLIVGLVSSLLCWVKFVRLVRAKTIFVVVSCAFLFSLWVARTVWACNVLNPLFLELIPSSDVNIDALFHSAVSQMIKTYDISTTGLNGTPSLHYHFGSHWFFAQLSKLLNLNALTFYQVGYPIIFLPLFFNSLMLFVTELKSGFGLSVKKWDVAVDYIYWFILVAAFVCILPMPFSDIFELRGLYISCESYGVALMLSFITGALLINVFHEHRHGDNADFKNKAIFYFVILPLMIGVIAFTKVSVGAMMIVLLGYLFIRLKFYKSVAPAVSMVLVATSVLLVAMWYKGMGSHNSFFPFYYVTRYVISRTLGHFHLLEGLDRSHVPIGVYLVALCAAFCFVVFHYLWTWIYVIFSVREGKFGKWRGFIEGKHLDIEAVFLLSFVGFLPGAVLDLHSVASGFFSDVQKWLALSLLLARMPQASVNIWKQTRKYLVPFQYKRLALVSVAALVLMGLTTNLAESCVTLITSNIDARNQIIYGNDYKYNASEDSKQGISYLNSVSLSQRLKLLVDRFYFMKDQPQKILSSNQKSSLVRDLKSLDQKTLTEKRKSVLYIPRSNHLFWKMQPCGRVAFVAPALSGIAMIRGLPDPQCAVNRHSYGYGTYDWVNSRMMSGDANLEDIYLEAQSMGFDKVIVIEDGILKESNVSGASNTE